MPLISTNKKKFKKKMNKVSRKKLWNIALDYCINSVITDALSQKTIWTGTPIKSVSDHVKTSIGCSCSSCGNFNEYAEPNQVDGTFLCFSCRSMG